MDSVVLTIPKEKYKVIQPELFRPTFKSLDPSRIEERIVYLREHKGVRQFRQNSTVENRSRGVVLPNLNIVESARPTDYRCDLKVHISLPKLLKGHSFWELSEMFLPEICDRLTKGLLSMGVTIDQRDIATAQVSTVHFCRNILLTSEEEARNLLSKLNRISLGGWYENHLRDYANTGSTVRFHSDVFEFVVYLKYYDLFDPKSRCVDKKRTKQEKQLAKSSLGHYKPLVRFECRMNGTRPIRNHLYKCTGVDKSVWTLVELIDRKIERQVLVNYWQKLITDPANRIVLENIDDQTLVYKVIEKFGSKTTSQNVFVGVGSYYFIKSLGVNQSRKIVIGKFGRNYWNVTRRQIADFMAKVASEPDPLLKHIENILATGPIQYELPI